MAAVRSAMDLFPDGIYVRLRSRVHETYLYADEDGAGLSLRPRSYGPAIAGVWRVHRVERDGIGYVLHGASYGRYLALCTDKPPPRHCVGCRAVQARFDHPALDAVMWRPVRVAAAPHPQRQPPRQRQVPHLEQRRQHRLLLRHPEHDEALDGRGRPARHSRLRLRTVPEADQGRVIKHLHSDQPLNFDPQSVPHFYFYSCSVFNLRTQLANHANQGNIFGTLMCVREGLHGRLTPLVTDLANCNKSMHIVVYTYGAPECKPNPA